MKDAKGILLPKGTTMAEGFIVTYRFTTPSDLNNFYGYESKPYRTKAEAESYLQAVLARALIKGIHIMDWQLWHGSELLVQF